MLTCRYRRSDGTGHWVTGGQCSRAWWTATDSQVFVYSDSVPFGLPPRALRPVPSRQSTTRCSWQPAIPAARQIRCRRLRRMYWRTVSCWTPASSRKRSVVYVQTYATFTLCARPPTLRWFEWRLANRRASSCCDEHAYDVYEVHAGIVMSAAATKKNSDLHAHCACTSVLTLVKIFSFFLLTLTLLTVGPRIKTWLTSKSGRFPRKRFSRFIRSFSQINCPKLEYENFERELSRIDKSKRVLVATNPNKHGINKRTVTVLGSLVAIIECHSLFK